MVTQLLLGKTPLNQLIQVFHAVLEGVLIHQIVTVVMRECNALFLAPCTQLHEKARALFLQS